MMILDGWHGKIPAFSYLSEVQIFCEMTQMTKNIFHSSAEHKLIRTMHFYTGESERTHPQEKQDLIVL